MNAPHPIATDLADHFADFGCILRDSIRFQPTALAAKMANGDAYMMSLEDVEDRAHRSVMTRTDALTGITWADWKPLSSERWFSVAIDTPLCGGCDHVLDANGDCEMCSTPADHLEARA